MPDLPLKGYTSGVIEGIPTFVWTVVGQYIVPKYQLGPPKAQIDDLGGTLHLTGVPLKYSLKKFWGLRPQIRAVMDCANMPYTTPLRIVAQRCTTPPLIGPHEPSER